MPFHPFLKQSTDAVAGFLKNLSEPLRRSGGSRACRVKEQDRTYGSTVIATVKAMQDVILET